MDIEPVLILASPILGAMFVVCLILNLFSKNDNEELEISRKFDTLEDKLILNPLTKIGYLKNEEKYMKCERYEKAMQSI